MKAKPKIDLSAQAAPLQADPFAALGGLAGLPPGPAEPPSPAPAPGIKPRFKERLILRREVKGRGGKTVVVISGFPGAGAFPEREIEELARGLRKTLGCGGAVEGREIVLQGDRPSAVAEALRRLGFSVGGVVA